MGISKGTAGSTRGKVALIFVLLAAETVQAGTTVVTVMPDGTFSPSTVTIRHGQKVQWTGLGRTDSIVQTGDPATAPSADPCGILDSQLDHAFDGNDDNEFTGPSRRAVSGIFSLGPTDPGFVEKPAAQACLCESLPSPCTPLTVAAVDGHSYKLCPREGADLGNLDATWSNPDLTGVTIRMGWNEIQVDAGGSIDFNWTALDREMDKAASSGKLFTLDVKAGKDGTPDWIFTDYNGPAGPGIVAPLRFEDWGSEQVPPSSTCGIPMKLGSPTDPNYRDLYTSMLQGLAEHVASDSRWFQALAYVKLSGANFLSSEARLPHRCWDGDDDGSLDIRTAANGSPDPCICNAKVWADSGFTPEGLYEYYRVVGNTAWESFFRRKSMGYQLIANGFPRVSSATNFEGDHLLDVAGHPLLPPPAGPGVAGDEIGATVETETVLAELGLGRFSDPFGSHADHRAGALLVPQNDSLQDLPDDSGRPSCSQAATVDPLTKKAAFPLPRGTLGDGSSGCPNPQAVEQGTVDGKIMGFQTTNATSVASPRDVESSLWNLTINSDATFVELYEDRLWEIAKLRGTGAVAAPIDPTRTSLVGNPAPWSKTLHDWSEELHDRRLAMSKRSERTNLADPFPPTYTFRFRKKIAAPTVYHYINPARCGSTNSTDRVGTIIVEP